MTEPDRVHRYGLDALLVDVPSAAHARHMAERVRARPGVLDAVPSATSLLITCADATAIPKLARWASDAAGNLPDLPDLAPATGALIEIPVSYDGADLGSVAAATGLTPREVIERHTAATYTAAFAGFAPGFVYLDGLDPTLRLPRRTDPRTRVPTGSVAIAHDYTAVYPRESPGGWHLIGSTEVAMFDAARSRPATIEPGQRVRFVEAAR